MPFTRRTHHDWHLRTRILPLGARTVIMGILNVTPDSFSDGGYFYSHQHAPERALAQALKMLEEGAEILDIGGESTRPNATQLSADEEQSRILPVLESILKEKPGTLLSIDTFHATTARRALEAGAEIINDVSGHLWDPDMSKTCAQSGCGAILMHTRGRPQEWPSLPPLAPEAVLPLILTGLAERLESATAAGVQRNKIVLDPGFGFGKRLDENYPLLAHFDQLNRFDLPILAGISRKGFLAHTLAQSPSLSVLLEGATPSMDDRLQASTAANVAAILAGARILRTHDVRPTVEAAAIADQILAAH
ncbi:dihydropteroate synthase [Tunturibacter empetritectus]|uniref:Dihydropteroate synthase n=1 Tax=Tunturiibacter empetritectus TaxID=3069691 RepID=A0A7W8IK89_9BACT|nr:dihydropteroate synthase [Edaphobacter lichenicola]MBB5318706.1 dihydropteroate synthase [Edaphobacter lichenicola]